MNKKGQTLIAFVIIIPVFILFLAFVVDIGIYLKEYTKWNSTTRTILKTTYYNKDDENYKEKVAELYEKNNISTKNLKIDINENKIKIENEYGKESIFGRIIGLKVYKIKDVISIQEINGKLQLEKE